MVNRLVSVDDSSLQLPTDVREAQAGNFGDDSTPEGAALVASYAARRVFDVRTFGATGDGVTDDGAAIEAAINAAKLVRGEVYFPYGHYITGRTLILYSNVLWRGDGPGSSRVKLANGANVDLVKSDGFATFTGGSTQDGPDRFGIVNMRLDGNGTNQSATSWTFRVYGRSYEITNVEILNGRDGNVFSEWGTGGLEMEAHWTNFKVGSAVNGPGIDWRGPHDSDFKGGFVYKNGEASGTWDGIKTSGNAGGDLFSNVHVWGNHLNGFNIRKLAQCTGCVSEGAKEANVIIASTRTIWSGHIYGRAAGDSATEVGLQIGDGTSGAITGYLAQIATWNYANAASIPVKFVADSGGTLIASVNKATATVARSGTLNARTQLLLTVVDHDSSAAILPNLRVQGPGNQFIVSDGTSDRLRVSGATVQIGNGSELRGYSDNFSTETYRLYSNGAIKSRAVATGSRPAANTVAAGSRIYDTTLSKPIWSDGTTWRDATGTAV
jgi:hypothetical protein